MFTVPALSTSLLLYSASAFYFLCIVLWLNLWVPSFLSKLSVSRPSICLQVVNCNFDHNWRFYFAQLSSQWYELVFSGLFSTHPNALFIFQSNILAATFSHHPVFVSSQSCFIPDRHGQPGCNFAKYEWKEKKCLPVFCKS